MIMIMNAEKCNLELLNCYIKHIGGSFVLNKRDEINNGTLLLIQ